MTAQALRKLHDNTPQNSLKFYVLDQLVDSLEGYEDNADNLLLDALRGTNTGWWSGLIYYTDIAKFFNEHRHEICTTYIAFIEECGIELGEPLGNDGDTYGDLVKALTVTKSIDTVSNAAFTDTEHLVMNAVGIAVELICHDVESQIAD